VKSIPVLGISVPDYCDQVVTRSFDDKEYQWVDSYWAIAESPYPDGTYGLGQIAGHRFGPRHINWRMQLRSNS
jgi:hypothetical protein